MDTTINLLNGNNYIVVNKSLVKVFGLVPAVYCSEIFNTMKKIAILDCYQVKVDRDEIASTLGIPINEQKAIEERWRIMHLIEELPMEDNAFKVNVEAFTNIVAGTLVGSFNKEEVSKLKKKLSPKTSESDKAAKRASIAKNIKDSIACSDVKLSELIDTWIDAMTDAGRALSSSSVANFLKTIEEYSKGNKEVQYKIMNEAINGCYANVTYAIKAYEEHLKLKATNPTSEFRRATGKDLTGGHKF